MLHVFLFTVALIIIGGGVYWFMLRKKKATTVTNPTPSKIQACSNDDWEQRLK